MTYWTTECHVSQTETWNRVGRGNATLIDRCSEAALICRGGSSPQENSNWMWIESDDVKTRDNLQRGKISSIWETARAFPMLTWTNSSTTINSDPCDTASTAHHIFRTGKNGDYKNILMLIYNECWKQVGCLIFFGTCDSFFRIFG